MYDEIMEENGLESNQRNLELDPDDLIIIKNSLLWNPTDELVLSYANHCGFDILNDPHE